MYAPVPERTVLRPERDGDTERTGGMIRHPVRTIVVVRAHTVGRGCASSSALLAYVMVQEHVQNGSRCMEMSNEAS